MYPDKLDGRIDNSFFDRMSAEWREEQNTLLRELSFHQAADQSYLENGIRLLDLAVRAREIFEKRSPAEKHRLLKFVLSNCSWKEGNLTVMFRQHFSISLQKLAQHQPIHRAPKGEFHLKVLNGGPGGT
jgi:site-specific DNA recombinase